MGKPKPSDPWPGEYRLQMARKLLAEGCSLAEAARKVEMNKSDLDRALWNTIGTPLQ